MIKSYDDLGIIKFFKAIELLRNNVYKELPIQQIAIFLKVVMHEGLTLRNIGDSLNQHQATVSRNIKELSNYFVIVDGKPVDRGHNLLTTTPSKYNRREHSVFLTKYGQKIANEISNIMTASPEMDKDQDYELFITDGLLEEIAIGNNVQQDLILDSPIESPKQESRLSPATDDMILKYKLMMSKSSNNSCASKPKIKKTSILSTQIIPVETNQINSSSNTNIFVQQPKEIEHLDLQDIFINRSTYCADKLSKLNYNENAGSKVCTTIYIKLVKELKRDIEAAYGPFTIGELDLKTGKLTKVARKYKSLKQQFELLTKIGRNA